MENWVCKGSIGHAFAVVKDNESHNEGSLYPFVRGGISVPSELPLGHLRCGIADVPPQPNSPPDGGRRKWIKRA